MTRRYYIQALDDAIAELRANLSGPDDFGVWSGLRSVLFWLYSFEEWCRNTDGSYYGLFALKLGGGFDPWATRRG